ncbi:hypothetical protein BWI93_13545 [Siphonobacter sp. BAB-5385]|nr:hypothetical protein BWI93_13545 [Siphonobacter sp. BAB-5385]
MGFSTPGGFNFQTIPGFVRTANASTLLVDTDLIAYSGLGYGRGVTAVPALADADTVLSQTGHSSQHGEAG